MKRRQTIVHRSDEARPVSAPEGSPVGLEPVVWMVLLAALAYYAAFIWKTSFVIGGTRYLSLFDDAMISMRYARNLVRGHGLVWNVGQPPVEGFSNPLWTLMMGVAHLAPLPPHAMSIVIQGLGAAILLALLFSVRGLCTRLVHCGAPRALPLAAMVLVAFYHPLVYWTLEGMEVGLLALCTAVAAALLLAGRGLALPYLLLGAGTLVRLDFAVVAGSLAAGFALHDRARGARHLMVGFGAVLVAVVLQTAARFLYFHDLLPNTYYLKLTGYPLALRLRRGASVLMETVALSKGLLVLLPLAGLYLGRGDARRRLLLLMVPFLAVCGYSLWVGGDAWEGAIVCNRYLTVGVPLLLVAAAWPVAWLASRVGRGPEVESAIAAAVAVVVVLGVAPFRPTALLDAPAYREENQENTARGLAAAGLTRPGGSVAAAAVGAIGYYSDRTTIDLLGKTDRHVARLPARLPSGSRVYFVPGHLKWDYGYSIGALQPDVVAQLWWNPREADPHLLLDYESVEAVMAGRTFEFAVRRGSPFVNWRAGDGRDSVPGGKASAVGRSARGR